MRVDFFNFAKKSNSTKVPSGAALASFDCILKDGCSVISPVIMLEAGLTSRPAFNYCYIPDFQRYYFISDWTFNRRLWAGSLTVDVLASFKSQIGQKSMYVLRSSVSSNGRIVDNKYPTISKPYSYIDDMGPVYETDGGTDYEIPNFFNTTLGAGYYYIGVIGSNGTGVKWYVMDAYGFNKLAGDLMNYVPSDMTDISSGIAKQLANPIQYIVSSYWLPYLIHGAVLDQAGIDIFFGSYSIRAVHCVTFDPIGNMHRFHGDFTLRKHPQAATRGSYLNQGPYSRYTVDFQPFGVFELDGSLMIDDTTATCEWYMDYSTGQADLLVKVTNSFIAHSSALLGVPVRLSQATLDLANFSGDFALSMLGVSAQTNFWNPILGDTMAKVNSVALQPKIGTKGSNGSFIPFRLISPKLYTDFYLIADEDNADMGRPLMTVTTPATLGGGYIIAEKGDLEDTMALEDEIDMINSYISGGFFYE